MQLSQASESPEEKQHRMETGANILASWVILVLLVRATGRLWAVKKFDSWLFSCPLVVNQNHFQIYAFADSGCEQNLLNENLVK